MSSRGPALSVVVPTLEEGATIGRLLEALHRQEGLDLELIVSDGGSRDATVSEARAHGARVVEGPPGRGRQLNAGAAQARAPWLLFLHADSVLQAPELLARALLHAEAVLGPRDAGHFALRFVDAAELALELGFNEAKSALDLPETTHGDQGLLLRAATLRRLGGYDDQLPVLEDQDLGRRLHATGGRYHRLPGTLGTSARRFAAEGHARRSIQNAVLMVIFHAGLIQLLPRLRAHYPPPHSVRAPGTRALLHALHQTLAELPPPERSAAWRALARAARHLGLRDLAFLLDYQRGGSAAADHHPALDAWLERWEGRVQPWISTSVLGLGLRLSVGLGAQLMRTNQPTQ